MKIHHDQLAGLTGAGQTGAGQKGAGVGGAERSRAAEALQAGVERTEQRTPDGDRVQLSVLSNALRAESEDTPERLEKVQRLKDAYQAGRYEPDPTVVAKNLVDEALGGF